MTLPDQVLPAGDRSDEHLLKVPLSRSRTTAWDMIAINDSIKMAATSPGIIVFTVLSDGLNSTRTPASTWTRRRETLLRDPIRVQPSHDLAHGRCSLRLSCCPIRRPQRPTAQSRLCPAAPECLQE